MDNLNFNNQSCIHNNNLMELVNQCHKFYNSIKQVMANQFNNQLFNNSNRKECTSKIKVYQCNINNKS